MTAAMFIDGGFNEARRRDWKKIQTSVASSASLTSSRFFSLDKLEVR